MVGPDPQPSVRMGSDSRSVRFMTHVGQSRWLTLDSIVRLVLYNISSIHFLNGRVMGKWISFA